MESSMFGNVRPSPESCDDRGKRPTQETESESESESEEESEKELEKEFESEQKPDVESEKEPEKESESEQKPEEESETKPEEEWDWESKSMEEMQQKYDNDPKPRFFVCRNFVYENKVLKQQNEERKKAVDEYLEICRGISPFDPIPIPRAANFRGHNFPRELFITEERLERFTRISQIALADYNTRNQDIEYEFVELVKGVSQRIPLGTYYITFNAKPKDATSNCSSTTFQAHVVDNMRGTVIKSCSTKTKIHGPWWMQCNGYDFLQRE